MKRKAIVVAVAGAWAVSMGSAASADPVQTPVNGSVAEVIQPSPDDISEDEMNRLMTEGTSPYVEASSPTDAVAKLNRLESRAAAGFVKYGPCKLYPRKVWLRTSSGRKDVGTKPRTECTKTVSSIRHSTDMRYKSFIWWKKAGTYKSGPARGTKAHTSNNVGYRCKSGEKTWWAGTTLGTMVYNGRTYYARVYTAKLRLPCGG